VTGWISPRRLRQLGMLGMNARNVDFIGRYNKRALFPLVDDKLKTKLLAEEYGVPMPKLRFVVSEQHEIATVERQLTDLEGFAVKPARGSGGKGIWVITHRDGDAWVKSSGARIDAEQIRRHMTNTLAGLYSLAGRPDVIIVEDLIAFDDAFNGFSHEGVPDIRVIVFRGYPVMAMLRLATHASDGKANLHQGAVGVGLSLDAGSCLYAVQFGQPVTLHPDTGKPLSTIRIEGWRELLLLASSCYDMTGLGYIGTDIVIDRDRGPQLLELNARPGLSIQVANGRGLLPRLRHVESLPEKRRTSATDRVDYVMRHFGAGSTV
jgi:alpha-L-glutamate ligase-like protein